MAVAPIFYFSLTPAMNDGASHIVTNTRRTNWSRTLPIIRRTAWSGRTEFQPPRLRLRLIHPSPEGIPMGLSKEGNFVFSTSRLAGSLLNQYMQFFLQITRFLASFLDYVTDILCKNRVTVL